MQPCSLQGLAVVVQSLSHVPLFVTPLTAACQASLSFTTSQSLLKLTSVESVMPSNHLILCCPVFSCPQSFPASGSFPVSWLFASGGQSTGTSASNEYSGLISFRTGLISLQSKGLSRVVPSITVQRHQLFDVQPFLWSLTFIYDSWKNHSFDYKYLCWQSNVSAF